VAVTEAGAVVDDRDVVGVGSASCLDPFGGADVVQAEPFGEDRCGQSFGECDQRAVATGAARDSEYLEAPVRRGVAYRPRETDDYMNKDF
jgi:hypothetical protein